jgi:hypothetical protein
MSLPRSILFFAVCVDRTVVASIFENVLVDVSGTGISCWIEIVWPLSRYIKFVIGKRCNIEVVFLLLPEWRQYGIKKNRHHNSPDKKMVDAELSTPIRQKKSSLIKWNMKSLKKIMYIHIQDRSFTYIIMRTKTKKMFCSIWKWDYSILFSCILFITYPPNFHPPDIYHKT